MFVMGNLFLSLARVVDFLLNIVVWLIFFRAIISWVNPDPYNTIVQFLYRVTEPILQPFRRFGSLGRVDISPILVFILIIFLQSFLVATLRDIGIRMKQSEPTGSTSSILLEPINDKSAGQLGEFK